MTARSVRAMYFDTHAHLNDAQFEADREAVLARAQDRGVTRIVEIADAPADWDRVLGLCREGAPEVRCSLGLHPYHADEWRPELAEALVPKARLPQVVAVGEIGLDYAKCKIPPEQQKAALLGMLAAADAVGLPVVLHCREAYADMLPLLKDYYAGKPKTRRFRGVVHCFSGTKEEALESVQLGFALGVDGPVTYPKNEPLREALRAAGLENLVLETDSPYLPPQSSRGKRNEPSAIPEIASKLAFALLVPMEKVAEETRRNAHDLFAK